MQVLAACGNRRPVTNPKRLLRVGEEEQPNICKHPRLLSKTADVQPVRFIPTRSADRNDPALGVRELAPLDAREGLVQLLGEGADAAAAQHMILVQVVDHADG